MRTLVDIGHHRLARFWLGELPDATYECTQKVTHTLSAGGPRPDKTLNLAAAEVLVHVGGRMLYGLLGGRWQPESDSQLSVEVLVSTSNERLFPDSLAGGTDEVRVGLPSEYIEGVLDGIDLAKGELNFVAAGKLSIDHAAHGAIGSSNAIYKHLAAALVKLFNLAQTKPSDEELAALFPSTFN